MISNLFDFKSFFKFLNRNKAYTAIDVFGLSVSLMFVLLIAVYTAQELSVDSYQEKAGRVYTLGSEAGFGSAYKLAYRLEERFPEVEKVCPVNFYDHTPATIGDRQWAIDLMFADSTFFDFFSFDLVQGDRRRALEVRGNAVISESFARKVFGGEDPLGQTIRLQDSLFVTVGAVMRDIRRSTLPYCDVLVRIEHVGSYNEGLVSDNYSNAAGVITFVMEKEGADLKAREADMADYFREIFWIYQRDIWKDVRLTPLADVYFAEVSALSLFLRQGDRQFVLILLSIGILILLFAVINYVNLTVAQTGFRAREMATRRLLGASRGMLFARLVMESTLLSFVSLGIGVFLAYACVPFADTLLETKIFLTDAITPLSVVCVCAATVLLGVLSGLLPAFIISNTRPIEIVRGGFRRKTKMVFSKVFITFQQAITIALVAAVITMAWQTWHLIHAPLGYNTANIIDIPVMRLPDWQLQTTLGNELKQLAGVKRIAYSAGTPFNRGNNNTFEYEGRNISMQFIRCERAFFDILGIQIVRDNHVSGNSVSYLSEYAMKEFNLPEDAESVRIMNNTIPIGGVVRDFQLRNITQRMEVVCLEVYKPEDFYPWNILVEIQGDPYAAMDGVKEVYERVTRLEFDGQFIDRQVEETFASQKRLVKIVCVFGAIALLIALLGLLAMSTYFIQQRTREIGVRKVFGSSDREVLSRLIGAFLRYVLAGFAIATPVVWYVMNGWLSDYSYRIPLSPFIFLAAGAFCLIASFLTIYWQSYRAATQNPVESIKTE